MEIHLTKKEYEILVMFMRNPNVALFRERIFESVWHEPYYGDSRTVDLHVQRLRKKLGLKIKLYRYIRWDTGWRYKLEIILETIFIRLYLYDAGIFGVWNISDPFRIQKCKRKGYPERI